MGEISRLAFWRHFRSEPSSFVIRFRRGKAVAKGRGLTFWFMPLSASIAEVPLDDRELPFLFHGRARDFQDVSVQGAITFRFADPELVADRIDFTVDLARGTYLKKPLEQAATLLVQLAQQHAWEYLTRTSVQAIIAEGADALRARIEAGLGADEGLAAMGIAVVTVRIAVVKPTAELEKALQVPTFEAIQQDADEATFQRRALAVEKERAIQENELQNQIELARREEQLIAQEGQNGRNRASEEVEAARIRSDGEAERTRVGAEAEADALRAVEGVKVGSEKERMDIYRDLSTPVVLGLAARELAGKLQTIEHLNLSPDLIGPLLANLMRAGTERLGTAGEA
jgi:regulator of protease activity HflC (stomatin/prohibitin superfamily)